MPFLMSAGKGISRGPSSRAAGSSGGSLTTGCFDSPSGRGVALRFADRFDRFTLHLGCLDAEIALRRQVITPITEDPPVPAAAAVGVEHSRHQRRRATHAGGPPFRPAGGPPFRPGLAKGGATISPKLRRPRLRRIGVDPQPGRMTTDLSVMFVPHPVAPKPEAPRHPAITFRRPASVNDSQHAHACPPSPKFSPLRVIVLGSTPTLGTVCRVL